MGLLPWITTDTTVYNVLLNVCIVCSTRRVMSEKKSFLYSLNSFDEDKLIEWNLVH